MKRPESLPYQGTGLVSGLDIPMPPGAALPARTPVYRLTLHTGPIDRTTWWKDENRKEPANVWWLEGGGLNRPATDVEIEFWLRAERSAQQ